MKRKFATPLTWVLACTISAALFYSCQKSVDQTSDSLTSVSAASNDNAVFVNGSMDNLTAVEETYDLFIAIAPNSYEYLKNESGCPVSVTYDPAEDVYPHTTTVDYGTGCTDAFGITRSGKIQFYYTAPTTELHSKVYTQYDNFYVDGVKLEGRLKISQNRNSSDSTTNYRMTYKNRKSIYPSGDYIIVNGHRRAIKLGGGKIDFPNGTFQLSGSLDYTQEIGGVFAQYTTTINNENPLWYLAGCPWIVQGQLHYAYSDGTTQDLDYGDGTCDDQAVLTDKDGNVKTITLH